MLKFKKRVLCYSYDRTMITQEKIIALEMEMYSDVPNKDKRPGTVYQSKEGFIFMFENCQYNAKEGVLTYHVQQIIEVPPAPKSNIIVPGLIN